MTWIPSDTERCDRCGMLLLARLCAFHQCKGTDARLRPANIPREQWSVPVDPSALFPGPSLESFRPKPARVPHRESPWPYIASIALFAILMGGAVAMVIWGNK